MQRIVYGIATHSGITRGSVRSDRQTSTKAERAGELPPPQTGNNATVHPPLFALSLFSDNNEICFLLISSGNVLIHLANGCQAQSEILVFFFISFKNKQRLWLF